MDFNSAISEQLGTLQALQGVKVVEESTHIVKFESGDSFIRLVQNPRENSYGLWVGRKCFSAI